MIALFIVVQDGPYPTAVQVSDYNNCIVIAHKENARCLIVMKNLAVDTKTMDTEFRDKQK